MVLLRNGASQTSLNFYLIPRTQLMIAAIMVLAICVPVLAQRPAASQKTQAAAEDPLDQFNASVEDLVKKVWPSVVQIQVTSYGPREESDRGNTTVTVGRQRSVGSGFVIDTDGYIMTNAHVVNGAQRIQIVLPPSNADGSLRSALSGKTRTVPARLVGFSSEIDLALLKIEGKVPALPLATYTKVRQGEIVFAFGSPGGLRNTITRGIVSAVARQTDPDSPLIYIQTDAAINPGNSGGPLVNAKGEVVGVNTFILSQSGGSEGLNFAIPCATARTVFRQFRQYGQLRRQEIGIGIQTITPAMATGLGLARDYGVIISDVLPGSPAESRGVKPGDVLVSIDGQPADNLPTVNYMFRLRDSNNDVQLVVQRGTAQQTFSVPAIEVKSEFDQVSSMADAEKNLVAPLGILGIQIDERILSVAKGLRGPYGIIVAARVSGATSEVPLAVGDVIRDLNGKPMNTLDTLRSTLRSVPAGAPITLQVQREGRLLYVTFTLD
ncbi:MAG TPA: trypsin-like peptidase domain-containing protein [Pyrinomonadaceae bacterium]|nr:trypsin-like peptidase domain-containing protein [Pyrinomonadaceae bacterium]